MNAHVRTKSILAGTLLSKDLKRCRRMFEDVLGMQCVEPQKGVMYIRDKGFGKGEDKHGQPYWVLEVRERSEIMVPQEMLNHWGFAAPTQAAVDEAFARLSEAKETYGITRVQKPRFRNGSYAVYFVDEDSNWWELEYRTPDIVYDALRLKGDQF